LIAGLRPKKGKREGKKIRESFRARVYLEIWAKIVRSLQKVFLRVSGQAEMV
jgi:hypothetical protein